MRKVFGVRRAELGGFDTYAPFRGDLYNKYFTLAIQVASVYRVYIVSCAIERSVGGGEGLNVSTW